MYYCVTEHLTRINKMNLKLIDLQSEHIIKVTARSSQEIKHIIDWQH